MTKKLVILLAIIVVFTSFAQDSLGIEIKEQKEERETAQLSLQPHSRGHESLLSTERLSQFRSLSLGYSTDGESSVSMMSYLHGFDYIFGPNLKTSATLELSRFQSREGQAVELTPRIQLDWRPFEGGRLKLDLRLPPQRLYGTGLNNDFKTNILRR